MKIFNKRIPPIASRPQRIILPLLRMFGLMVVLGSLVACTPTVQVPVSPSTASVLQQEAAKVNPPQAQKGKNLGVVAVAEVSIEHPAAIRVFSEQVVRDAITREVHHSGRMNVLDWSRLKAVLFRRNLEWSDLVDNAAVRQQVKDVLLNDYFLTASLYSYGERMDYSSNAFSKSKTQIAEVVMDLFIKDALTNEIIASARGTGIQQRSVTQSLGFGAAGGSDPTLAKAALDGAVNNGVRDLLQGLENHSSTTFIKEKSQ